MEGSKCYSIWILIVLTVFNKFSLSSTCGTVMFTDKTIYKIGETIHLNCSVTSENSPPKSSNFRIVRLLNNIQNSIKHEKGNQSGNMTVPTIFRVTNFTGITEIKVRSIFDEGTYICYYGNCTDVMLTSAERIHVSRDVSPFRRPEMRCVSDSFWNMTCHWDTLHSDVVSSYRIHFKNEGDPVEHCCGGKSNCDEFIFYADCFVPKEQFHWGLRYNITLQIKIYDNTTNNYTYSVVADNSIVRLHIDELTISTPSKRQLQLMFTSDLAPLSVGGVECHVTVVSQWEEELSFNISFTSNSSSLTVSRTLKSNLQPYTTYILTLTCRPSVSSYWSNVLTAKGTTLPEPPVVPPKVYGYSNLLTGEMERNVIIYVQTMSERCYYAKEAYFTIDIGLHNITFSRTFDAVSSTASLNVTLLRNVAYTLALSTVNGVGKSKSSLFVIPEIDNQTNTGDIVVDKGADDKFDVLLFGFGSQYVTAQTCYFTCKIKDERVPPNCLEDIKKHCEDGFIERFELPVNYKYDDENNIAVGVALETNTTNSLDILWSECVFKVMSNYKESKLPVTVTKLNATSMQVTLNFRYCQLPRRPILYQIATRSGYEDMCHFNDCQNITATPSLSHINLDVQALDAVRSVCFRAIYDEDEPTSAFDAVFEKYTAVVQYEHSKIEAGIGIAAGLGLCGLVLLCFGLDRYRRRLKSRSLVKDVFVDLISPGNNPTEYEGTYAPEGSYRTITCEPTSTSYYDTVEDMARSRTTSLASYNRAFDVDVTTYHSNINDSVQLEDAKQIHVSSENGVSLSTNQRRTDIFNVQDDEIDTHVYTNKNVYKKNANTSECSVIFSSDTHYMQVEGSNSNESCDIDNRTYIIDTTYPRVIDKCTDRSIANKQTSASRKHSTESRTLSNDQNVDILFNEPPVRAFTNTVDINYSSMSSVGFDSNVDSYLCVSLPIDSGETVSNYVTMVNMS